MPPRCWTSNIEQYIADAHAYGIEELLGDDGEPKEWIKYIDGVYFKILSPSPTMGVWKISPGAELPAHYHDYLECYYIVKGTAMTLHDNEMTPMTAGDWVEIPHNHIHYSINGEEELNAFYWFPVDSQDFFTYVYVFEKDETDADNLKLFSEVRDLSAYLHEANQCMKDSSCAETGEASTTKNSECQQSEGSPAEEYLQ